MRAPAIVVERADAGSAEAQALMDELSDALRAITGDSGRASFDPADVCVPRGCFAIARDASGRPLGCGALRPMGDAAAELKRMFARPGTAGVGSAVLRFLEAEAQRLGFATICLETRRVNTRAVAFYERRGYRPVENYGKYVGNAQAVCFTKPVDADAGA